MRMRLGMVIVVTMMTTLALQFIILWMQGDDRWKKSESWDWSVLVQTFQTVLQDSVKRVLPSIVSIHASRQITMVESAPWIGQGNYPWTNETQVQTRTVKRHIWGGSAFYVASWWYFLTNKHVIHDMTVDYEVVFSDGTRAHIENYWMDPFLDVALVKINDSLILKDLQPLTAVSVYEPIEVGQFVLAVGNVLAEYHNSVTFGVISGKNRNIGLDDGGRYAWLYQTDASINRWNSWWPLMSFDGKVLWLNTAVSSDADWVWFALPLHQEFLDATVQSVVEYNRIVRPFVWIEYTVLSPVVASERSLARRNGIFIEQVVAWSPAEQASLQPWDIITAINWLLLDDQYPFLYLLYSFHPKDTVTFTVETQGIPREVTILLTSHE
jgi:serine protease Do